MPPCVALAEQGQRQRDSLFRGPSVKYVYLLRSLSDPSRKYVDITGNLNQRLAEHNGGKSPHTRK